MSSRTQPLPTPMMKKMLPRTRQTVTKTEDSLVFSWEGRHIPFISPLFWTFILDVLFSFSRLIFLVFASVLNVISHVRILHSEFHCCFNFAPYVFGQFPFIRRNTSMAQHFRFARYLCKMPRSRGFMAMMNHSEPFLFLFDCYVSP